MGRRKARRTEGIFERHVADHFERAFTKRGDSQTIAILIVGGFTVSKLVIETEGHRLDWDKFGTSS